MGTANHWIIIPIIFPAMIAALITIIFRNNIIIQRILSIVSTSLIVFVTFFLLMSVKSHNNQVYLISHWPAPYGIVLILEQLSALMMFISSLLAMFIIIYASHRIDRNGKYFHILFHFQLMGINGAFLTGDIFNLFVFF